MRKTSSCPNCQEPLTLVEAPPASLVECPVCQSRFPLEQVLDFVAESDEEYGPAELLVVEIRQAETDPHDVGSPQDIPDGPQAELPESVDFLPAADSQLPHSGSQEDVSGELPLLAEERSLKDADPSRRSGPEDMRDSTGELLGEAVTAEAPEAQPAEVRCPCCRQSFPLQDLLLARNDEPLGRQAASAILPDGSIRQSADPGAGVKIDFGAVPAADHSDFRLDSVQARPDATADAFTFAAPVGVDSARAVRSDEERPRRRRPERGGVKDMVGAMLGGAAGLLITYYFLNLLGGPRFDMLHVYLPGVKHTADYRPGWLGGPPKDEFDSGIGDGLDLGPTTPQPPSVTPPAPPDPQGKREPTPPVQQPLVTPDAQPAPAESAPPADYVGPVQPPQVTSEDLGRALREIDQLSKAGPMTGEIYEHWCRAAEAATFIDRIDGNPQTQGRLDAMQRLLKDLTLDDVKTIGSLATQRRLAPDRPSRGILLAGTARNPNTPRGKGFVTGLVVAETGAQVVIASDRKLPVQADDRILVPGYIVDEPKQATQGLDTDLPQIIWTRTVAKFGGQKATAVPPSPD
ncbi:MAG: hypothetical protein ACYC6Y_27340 [Thermoguttaceae bacterium]